MSARPEHSSGRGMTAVFMVFACAGAAAGLGAGLGASMGRGPMAPGGPSASAPATAASAPIAADPIAAPPGGKGVIEQVIELDSLRTWHVTSLGNVLEPIVTGDGNTRGRCNQTASHTDANFEGGSFVAQLGFAEGESFGAHYVLNASDFPIKIDFTEVIVATANATIDTTTQWSMSFYQGDPKNGTLVATYSSDGTILPHIEMGSGTNGVNVQFSIDPGDPDQIVINNNGSNSFSIAFRIDEHNQPPANGCSSAPPQCCNAFPCTDISGLQQSSRNYLHGLDCGPFGCPANGGWASFAQLPSFCRPSGDVVMRAHWSSLDCTPGLGACCLPDGTCEVIAQSDCQNRGGTYQGDSTNCGQVSCPQPTGACCFNNGFCLTLTQGNCQGAGGTWQGGGTVCGSGNTCPTGACCLPDGSCVSNITSSACTGMGGTFKGVGSSCGTANCPQPAGACCFFNGFCLELLEADCDGAGGTWGGPLTTCADTNGNGQADLCEAPTCRADYNQDGTLDAFDYDDFVSDYFNYINNGVGFPDYNLDGYVDAFDYDDFVSEYFQGC